MFDMSNNSAIINPPFKSLWGYFIILLFCESLAILLIIGIGLLPFIAGLGSLLLIILFTKDIKYYLYFFPFFIGVPLKLIPSLGPRGHVLNIILFVAFALVFGRLAISGKDLSFSIPKKATIISFLLCISFSIVVTRNLPISLYELAKLLIILAISYTFIYNILDNEKSVRMLYYTIIFAGVASAFNGILESYLLTGRISLSGGTRIFAGAGGGYGAFIGTALSFAFAVLLYERKRVKARLLCLLSLPPMVMALALSQTRAWILGSIIACLVLLCYKVFKGARLINKVIFMICFILFLTIFSGQVRNAGSFMFIREDRPMIHNIISSEVYDTSLMIRLQRWQVGWNLFLENPLTGVGIGNVRKTSGAFNTDNHYVGVLAETGIIGSFGWILLILAILKSIRNTSRSITNSEQRMILSGISGGLIVFLIGGIFWNLTSGTLDSSRLFLLISMLFSMEKIVITRTVKEN